MAAVVMTAITNTMQKVLKRELLKRELEKRSKMKIS